MLTGQLFLVRLFPTHLPYGILVQDSDGIKIQISLCSQIGWLHTLRNLPGQRKTERRRKREVAETGLYSIHVGA
ncbi:hypothetical protein LZ554_005774 [Drepanopeziza brunnea f. sp. 'monogermtubi']|nr:hypothetical protein LZ554_005774 [Drepanopeziza brunnea f. sp. 'monogermtubi']